MASENLRKIAAELRETAAKVEHESMVKCAQTIKAATALAMLREKVRNHVC